ncbi:hypothetical protein ACTRW9_13175 [Nitrospina sp. 32_T5]|uniref:hypothetical protein n=1 Tax=unclassified Nitrospina TaxID=2638683 RepID=UPI003F9BAAE8
MVGDNLFAIVISIFWNLTATGKFFVTAILGLTVVSLFMPGKYKDLKSSVLPNFLISLGILGTFIGICNGLMEFDPNEIRASVPKLLEGMKTAFISSIAGIIGGLLVKVSHYYTERKDYKKEDRLPESITIADLYKKLNGIHHSMVGNEESSLITQVKNFRTDTRDELQKLNNSVEKFLKDMAENNSKALIQALEEVMRDFNAKINEQFGENFKQLNEAVGKILEWQERYRIQMEEMIQQQTQTTTNMSEAVEHFRQTMKNGENLHLISESMRELLQGLEAQRNDLKKHLKAFAEVSDKAVNGLPKIEEEVVRLTKGFSDSITKSNHEINQHVEQVINRCEEQVQNLDRALAEELNNALKSLGNNMAAISEKFAADYLPLAERLHTVLRIAEGNGR